jgi:hypothetical protein
MKEEYYCGECCYMMEEDIDGRGWCSIKDIYTFVECDDKTCEDFEPKKEKDNE